MSKNDFGGGNARSLYIPMTDVEQDFIARLVDSKDLKVIVHEWGYINEPIVIFGDKNLHVKLNMAFDKPENPMPVHFFDLELQTRSGICLFRQKMMTEYGGRPLMIKQGVTLDMVWDIAINHIDPKLIKALMPNVVGLTSRRQDRDTGEMTVEGNMRLNSDLKRKAYKLHETELSLPQMERDWRATARQEAKKDSSNKGG